MADLPYLYNSKGMHREQAVELGELHITAYQSAMVQ